MLAEESLTDLVVVVLFFAIVRSVLWSASVPTTFGTFTWCPTPAVALTSYLLAMVDSFDDIGVDANADSGVDVDADADRELPEDDTPNTKRPSPRSISCNRRCAQISQKMHD